LEHIIPPRDLRSWQNLPISAIAHFTPVVIEDRSEGALRELLAQHPYRYFPVAESGRLKGVAARVEVEASLGEHRPVRFVPAITSRPGEIIREMQDRFIETSTGFIVLSDSPEGSVLGVVTLHDVLRAQVAMSERENGD
jgi:CIC family chloride channel protein